MGTEFPVIRKHYIALTNLAFATRDLHIRTSILIMGGFSSIEIQKNSPLELILPHPSAFSNRPFHRIFKPTLTVAPAFNFVRGVTDTL